MKFVVFIVLLLFFSSYGSLESSLNSLYDNQQNFKYSSFDNLPENVGEMFDMEISDKENTEIDPAKNAAKEAHNEYLRRRLLPDTRYLINEPPIDIDVVVGYKIILYIPGKRLFEDGTRSEYEWKINREGSSSFENFLIGHLRMIRQEQYDDIPDLFQLNVVPIEPGNNVLKLEELRSRDGSVRSTRTVNINCQITNTVYVNNRQDREINAVVYKSIIFYVRLAKDKPEYKWVIDASATSSSLRIGPIYDAFDGTNIYVDGYPVQLFIADPRKLGTQFLKLSYQKSNGESLLTSTITIRTRDDRPEYIAAREAAMEAYNQKVSGFGRNSYIQNEDTADIYGKVGQAQFVVVDGKYQFENETMNEYVWEADTEKSSKKLIIDTSSFLLRNLFDDVPDLINIRFVPIDSGDPILKLQYIRRSDKHVRATRTIIINSQNDNKVFINDDSPKNIQTVINTHITFFLPINPDQPDSQWISDDVRPEALHLGPILDNNPSPMLRNFLKRVIVVPVMGGTHSFKLSYKKLNGDILRSSTITIRSRNESPEYIAAEKEARKTYNQILLNLPASTFLSSEQRVFRRRIVGSYQSVVMDGKRSFENGTMNEYKWEPDLEKSSKKLMIGPSTILFESRFDDIPELVSIPFIQIEEGSQELKLQYKSDTDSRASRSVDTTGLEDNLIYINDKPVTTIETNINKEISIFLKIDPDRLDYNWEVSEYSSSLTIGEFADGPDFGRNTWSNWQTTKNVNVTATERGQSQLKFIYKNNEGDILRECSVTINC